MPIAWFCSDRQSGQWGNQHHCKQNALRHLHQNWGKNFFLGARNTCTDHLLIDLQANTLQLRWLYKVICLMSGLTNQGAFWTKPLTNRATNHPGSWFSSLPQRRTSKRASFSNLTVDSLIVDDPRPSDRFFICGGERTTWCAAVTMPLTWMCTFFHRAEKDTLVYFSFTFGTLHTTQSPTRFFIFLISSNQFFRMQSIKEATYGWH